MLVLDGVQGSEKLTTPLHLEVSQASARARAAVEAAGGSVTTVYYNKLGVGFHHALGLLVALSLCTGPAHLPDQGPGVSLRLCTFPSPGRRRGAATVMWHATIGQPASWAPREVSGFRVEPLKPETLQNPKTLYGQDGVLAG